MNVEVLFSFAIKVKLLLCLTAHFIHSYVVSDIHTSLNGGVTMSSANGLVGIGFVSRYWLQPRAGF